MREKLLSKLMLLLAFMLVGAGTASAQKVTAVEDIEDGGHYYIGCTVSGTDYYLYVNPSASAKGEKRESTEDATEFIFNKGENGWVIEIASSGKYITLPSSKDNAKVNVQDEAAEWEATNESDLIQLKINGFLLQGNNSSSLNFGSYASGQKNVWLLPVGTNIVETVKTPTFTPAAGEVEAGTEVAIATATEGAAIYYTVDGTDPTTNSTKGNTVKVEKDMTIKAIAVKEGMNNSAVATAEYTIKEESGSGDEGDTKTDVLNREFTGITGTTYTEWSGKTSNSDAVYAGQSAGSNESIQLRSNNNNSGVVTTTSGGKVKKIIVTWNSNTADGRTLNVYGSNTAYTAATDLYDEEKQGTLLGTIVNGTNTELVVTGDYEYVGLRSASGAMYLDKVEIVWAIPEGGETSTAVATTVTIDATGITNTNLFAGTAAGKLTAVVKTASGEVVEGAVVAWELDNEDVASVGNDGTVTLESAGTAVITASYAGVKDQYKPSEATYTLTVTYEDPNGPGTADNPYTVAQAVAAIDAGVGVKAIYVKGIISQLDSYNSTYKSITYWISADGTTTDQFEVYSGRGLDDTDFAALTDLKLGDEVVIYGNIKKYGDVYEFDKQNYIVSLVRAEKQDAGLAYETTSFTINVGESFTAPELTNPNNLTVTYTSSNESVATVDANTGAVTLANGTGVTTIKAKFEGNDNYFAGEASYTLEVVDPNVPGKTVENAYTVAQARAAIDAGAGVTGVYAKGIVSKIVTAYNSQYGNITYNISEDGSTTADQLQAFRGFSYDGAWFTSTEDIQVGDEVVVYGDLTKYNSTYEFGAGNQLVSLVRPQIVVAEPTFSVAAGEVAVGTKVELVQKDAEEIWYTTDGTDPDFVTGAGEIYTEPIVVNETTTIKAIAVIGNYQSTVASATYTVVEVQPAAEYATLPFKFDGKVADIEGTEGLTHEGIDGKDYSKSPYLKFNTTGDYMVLKIDEVPGALTFDIQGNGFEPGTFKVQTSADGLTYTDVRTYSALLEGGNTVHSELVNLKSDVRYIKWIYTEKSNGNVGIGNIELVADYKARVGEAGYATFVAPVAVDFAASDLTAYAVTEANAQGVMLEEVTAAPAGTPVVLQADAADYVLTLAERPVAPATNLLRASDATTKGDGTIFALGVANDQAGFYRVAEGAVVAADKAYLQIDAATGAVRNFLAFIGTADAIQQVVAESENAPVYNLNGQRVQKTQRGIYVKNGRVFVVK